ncbi:hypothetical protein Tco_1514684 [Tanacetum coccineum]
METEAIDNQANLVNYDNENENEIDDLGYQSEEYIEDAHEDDENNHSNGYAKRGITRLCKFRKEYGKPGGVKLSRYFDVDLTVRKLVKSAKAKMARSKCVFPHTIGRGRYAHVKEKMKETEDKIKEGTLQVDQGTDAMTLVLGKEKGGYARGVGSRVTYGTDN